ncbi:MAG: pyridoxamine 5'-phosphate oxidase [Flavobacteriaceae bacterium]|nr:pyridoxamine 5'-phosphate oxidase [Flavobacteriaceae bacterium]|tara:strand:- start:15490 stop:16023 length:534 start_codon:yes stop_codon:yes gene_type:complete
MGKQLKELNAALQNFIKDQKIFFVGTARAQGSVNVSPKGMNTFRIIDNRKIIWLNLTGSGNETAAHLLDNNRMTIMFCSFEEMPLILRLYGNAKIFHENEEEYVAYSPLFDKYVGARQIIEMDIDLVQSSCGYAVPFMEFKEERTQLAESDNKKGREGIRKYWKDKNTKSIDGFDTI